VHANDKKFSGEPDAGNLHVGFDEGRVGRTTVLPSLLLYRLTPKSQTAFLCALCETFVPFVVSFWWWLRYVVLVVFEFFSACDKFSSAAKGGCGP